VSRRGQGGFLLIAGIVLLVVVAALVATMASIAASSGGAATDNLQSGQALFLAESGLELETRSMAQNLDWYRATSDPFDLATQNFGTGSFTVSTNVPATKLRRNITNAANVVCVYTIDRFPAAGSLQLDDDITSGGEYATYTGTTASLAACNNLPAFTGVARGVTIGGVATTANVHTRGDRAYPVTTLAVAGLANSCTAPASFQVVAHSKFLDAQTLDIEGEEIAYTGTSTSGGNLVLTGVQRCQNGTISATHNVGVPVTPMLVDLAFPDVEAEMSSTGSVGSTKRAERKVVQR
jgi:uncharacterized Zn-binding protein involved in type VI secretion